MIRNFVTDTNLESFYPDLANYLSGGQIDYAAPIEAAFEQVLLDITNRGMNPVLLGVPIDLNRDASTSPNLQHPTARALTATTKGYAHAGGVQRRLAVNATVKPAGDKWTARLQGCNTIDRPIDDDPNWTTIKEFVWMENESPSEKTATFTAMHSWYRMAYEKHAGVGATFTAGLYETAYDVLISFKAIEIISASWKVEATDLWAGRYDLKKAEYESTLQAIKLTYDEDMDGIPSPPSESVKAETRFFL